MNAALFGLRCIYGAVLLLAPRRALAELARRAGRHASHDRGPGAGRP